MENNKFITKKRSILGIIIICNIALLTSIIWAGVDLFTPPPQPQPQPSITTNDDDDNKNEKRTIRDGAIFVLGIIVLFGFWFVFYEKVKELFKTARGGTIIEEDSVTNDLLPSVQKEIKIPTTKKKTENPRNIYN